MSRSQKLEKSDKWIVSLTALCAFMLFSWLVYDIAFLNPLLEGQVEIGKIYETQNKVKRKFNKSLIWYAADQNETVYENDWIFTGSQSIAKIRLDSGGEIVIEPDSLIILSRKNGVLQLDLQHGRLMADLKNKNIKINVVRDGAIETVDTSKGLVSVAQKESSDEDPLVESVDLDSDKDGKNDQSLSDLANQKYFKPDVGFAKLDNNGFSFQTKNEFNYNILRGQSVSTPLNWQDPFERWKNYEIEVSASNTFDNLISQKQTEEPGFAQTMKESKLLFWRVRGFNEEGQAGQWSTEQQTQVNIKYKDKGKPLQLSRQKLLYQLNNDDLAQVKPDRTYDVKSEKPIKIEWEKQDNASNYRVEISDKEDFSNIVEQKIVKDNYLDLKNIQLGKTYFRVTPETEDGVAISEEASGHVTTYFPAPDEESLETLDKETHQVVKWGKVPYAQAYQVTYKTDKNSDKEETKIVTGDRLKIENSSGFLQWKVRVVDPETKKWMSSNSETVDWYNASKRLASLHGTGQAGALYPKIIRPEPRKTFISVNNSPLFIVMNWDYEKSAPAYEVEISKKPDMQDLVYSKRVNKKRAVINQQFKPGIYFMRVRAASKDVTQETWSEVEVFRVINRKAN